MPCSACSCACKLHRLPLPSTRAKARSAHAAPLARASLPFLRSDGDGEVIGAVQLINKLNVRTKDRTKFGPHDLTLSQSIAGLIGQAMWHIQSRQHLEALHEGLGQIS